MRTVVLPQVLRQSLQEVRGRFAFVFEGAVQASLD